MPSPLPLLTLPEETLPVNIQETHQEPGDNLLEAPSSSLLLTLPDETLCVRIQETRQEPGTNLPVEQCKTKENALEQLQEPDKQQTKIKTVPTKKITIPQVLKKTAMRASIPPLVKKSTTEAMSTASKKVCNMNVSSFFL